MRFGIALLLKVADEVSVTMTLYGQEKDAATAGLAQMNMYLCTTAPLRKILQGNTLANPRFMDGDTLKTFDYVVANPPFSDKRRSNGVNVAEDPWERFKHFGAPPAKQGDYAYLLHIIRSLKSHGKGACILPHGVLFRGNAEGEIRRKLIGRGYISRLVHEALGRNPTAQGQYMPATDFIIYAGTGNAANTKDPHHRQRLLSLVRIDTGRIFNTWEIVPVNTWTSAQADHGGRWPWSYPMRNAWSIRDLPARILGCSEELSAIGRHRKPRRCSGGCAG